MIEPNEKTPDLMRLCYVAAWLPALILNKTNSQISGVYVETPLQDKNFHTLAYFPGRKREYETHKHDS